MKKKIFYLLFFILLSIYFYKIITAKLYMKEHFDEKFIKVMVTPTTNVLNHQYLLTFHENSFQFNYGKIINSIFPIINKPGDGSIKNIEALIHHKTDYVLAQENIILDAVLGKNHFEGNKHENLALISTVCELKICLIATINSNINSWRDLRHKNICFGRIGSGSYETMIQLCSSIGIQKSMLELVQGNIYDENILSMLMEDKIDAIGILTTQPNHNLKNLLQQKEFRIIGTSGISDVIFGSLFQTWSQTNFFLSDYEIQSINPVIHTYSTNLMFLTLKDQNNDTVYQLTDTLFRNSLYIKNQMDNKENKLALDYFQIGNSFPSHHVIPIHSAVLEYYSDLEMKNVKTQT